MSNGKKHEKTALIRGFLVDYLKMVGAAIGL